MDLSFIDWFIIVAFMALSLWIGVRYKNSAEKSLTDYFLSGRNLPWYVAGISMVATTFAADTPLAVTELVVKNGVSGNWLWWNFLAGGILTTFFFSKLWYKSGVLTELELIDFRYGGKEAKFLRLFKSVYLGVFINCMIIGWVNLALKDLLIAFFDVTNSQAYLLLFGFMIIAVVYSSLSGLKGVVITDNLQFILAITGSFILAIIVLNTPEVDGLKGLTEKLPQSYFNFFPSLSEVDVSEGENSNILSLTLGAFVAFAGMQWWASWYPGAEPGGGGYVAQRMMSTKSEKDSVLATLFFQFAHYCLRPWPWIIVALCSVVLFSAKYSAPGNEYIDSIASFSKVKTAEELAVFKTENPTIQIQNETQLLENNGVSSIEEISSYIPIYTNEISEYNQQIKFELNSRNGYLFAMKNFLPIGLKGLLLAAFIAAYLSTISTQLNWGASFVVNDFIKVLKPDFSQSKMIKISRIATLFIMVVGIIVTSFITSISGTWEFIMECGAGLGLVLILRWYWWRINVWSEITATIAPFIGYVISKFYLEEMFGEAFVLNKGTFIFNIVFTTVSWLIVTYLTKPTHENVLIAFYNKVQPNGAWGKFGHFNKVQFFKTALLWIVSITTIYSLLFLSGYILFSNTKAIVISSLVFIVSFILFIILLKNYFKNDINEA